MDTLGKILKTHKTPIHLRLKQGEYEVVIVTEYPHGYDIAHRYICDSLDDAFHKATGTPIGFTVEAYAWRVYDWEKQAVAQSPNLHQWLPDEEAALKIQKLEAELETCQKQFEADRTEFARQRDALQKRANTFYLDAQESHKGTEILNRRVGELYSLIEAHDALPTDVLDLQNKLVAMTRDRDEWRDSCKLANKRIDTTARAEKENHRLRKMLQAIVDYRTPMELRRLIGEAAQMLKEIAKHG